MPCPYWRFSVGTRQYRIPTEYRGDGSAVSLQISLVARSPMISVLTANIAVKACVKMKLAIGIKEFIYYDCS
ncbi:hypothetical protein QUB60_10415 [Microcoleus sp. A2-C5]|uniref:hypothetical protein n=1 Tax=unclassified Microcoleus TaxID=2642155 RepID=UPI002FD16AA3